MHDHYGIFLQFSFRKSFLVHADCITPRGSFFDRIMLLCFLRGCNVRVQVICWPGWLWKYVTPVVQSLLLWWALGLGAHIHTVAVWTYLMVFLSHYKCERK